MNFTTFSRFLFLILVITCSLSTLEGYSQTVEGDESQRDPVIWDVSFEGNENYSSVVLKNVISAQSPNFFRKLVRGFDNYRLDETELRRDGVRIQRYYGRRGYDQTEVEVEISERGDEWKKNVRFKIREGEPIRVKSVSVVMGEGATGAGALDLSEPFLKDAYDHALREGQPYQTIRIPEVEGTFTEKLQNNGFPWAEVSVDAEVDSAGKSADVKIELRPGAKSFFTNFMYDGIQTVPERIIRREMEIRNGELFDRRKIQNAQRQIFGHHLFRFATITLPEQTRDSTLDMQVRIRENPPRTLETMIGIGSEDLLRGQVSWSHRNINGTGHRLGFNVRGSFIEQRIGADYLVPYVFNSRSSFVAAPFAQRRLEPAFELMRLGITNSLIYQIERAKTVTGSYEFTINEEVSRRQEVSLPDTVQEFNISSLAFTGYFSENISRDPEGWVLQPSIELSGTFGEATFRFQKLTMDVRRYEPVSRTTTLAGRINLGTIFYTQPDSLPSNIRFFTGGTNSVRGWSRQDLGPKRPSFFEGEFDGFVPVGGRAVFTFNLEVRQQLNFLFNGFGMGVFLDGGQVWRAIDRINERPVQFGTGGGLRYQSPIGPVRIDIGYKINPFDEDLGRFRGEDRGSAWDRIGIHFSIGQAF